MSERPDPRRSEPLRAAAEAARGQDAWLVGGAVRDGLLGRATSDFDVVVDGDPGALARAVGRAAGGHPFALSEAFGAWRVAARDHAWQLDVIGLDGPNIDADLARRDLTINAIAEPLAGGELVDPLGGAADLRAGRLVMVSERSFTADPLRVLRVARFVSELGFAVDPATAGAARAAAPGLGGVAPERIWAELRALVVAPGALDGLEASEELGVTEVVLPELAALRGVEQSRYHHRDVHGHTLEVLAETIALLDDPGPRLGIDDDVAEALAATLAQPLADGLTRGEALRFAALLHDIAKPGTRAVTDSGRVTFMGHDDAGAELAREILGRLRTSERLRAHVAALVRHHLDLGFLVHEMPLERRRVYDYLHGSAPVEVDVTVLSVADRLATRGDGSETAIARHLELARGMVPEALRYEADPPRPPLRGDELATALGIVPGPALGGLLAELTAARWAGEIDGPEAAVALARRRLDDAPDGPR